MQIETKRLLLRPYEAGDMGNALLVLGDADTMRFYPRPYTLEEVARIVEKNMQTWSSGGYGLFAVLEKSTGAFLGDCGITVQDIDGKQEFEIGYRIRKEFWGRGIAVEAATAIREYGFRQLGLAKLCSYMASDHVQSRRVAEKIGMTLEKEFLNPRNRNFPTAVYSIFHPGRQSGEGPYAG